MSTTEFVPASDAGSASKRKWVIAGAFALATVVLLAGLASYQRQEKEDAAKAQADSAAERDRVFEEARKAEEARRKGASGIEWVVSAPTGLEFAKTETTVAQYRACVEDGACDRNHFLTESHNDYCNWGHFDRDAHPINCVNWTGAEQFCGWVGGRLPTEGEWYAEASDRGRRKYPWGDEEVTCDRAVWWDGSRGGCGKDHSWEVCSKPPGNSVSGLCDMSGNVWEWTSSLWDSHDDWRVALGGSWGSLDPGLLRASARLGYVPEPRVYIYGFRCVR